MGVGGRGSLPLLRACVKEGRKGREKGASSEAGARKRRAANQRKRRGERRVRGLPSPLRQKSRKWERRRREELASS